MKFKLLLAILTLIAHSTFSQTDNAEKPGKEKARAGIKAGLNISRFNASINSESSSKAGFHIGFYDKIPVARNFYVRLELYYSQQGQKDNYVYNGQSLGKTTTSVNYFNLPVIFEAGKVVTFQFGCQLGLLLSAHEKGTIDGDAVNDDLKSIMNNIDFAGVLGVGFTPGNGDFNFGLRYNIGLANIFKKPDGFSDFPDVKNQVFHLYVAYSFNKVD